MMKRQVSASAPTGAARSAELNGYPDECPRCHRMLVPRHLGTFAHTLDPESDIEEVFQCTSAGCGGMFVGVYRLVEARASPPRYAFRGSIPREPEKPQVSELVAGLSPTFLETYSQAIIGESLGLTQLTGIGLRKALEFLVKDFAVSEHPGAKAEIVAKSLAACIGDYIADSSTKEMAKRAAWLGNDETHYLRKWEDKDVEDLKVLLRLTINGIENILLTKKYIVEMPQA